MALFQKSVLNKFIKSQDTVKIEAAYQRFSDNFQKAERQAEIRSMKEEEYQDGFLDDLFVNILGYIKRPNAGFNLVREKKNEADSKKADGAILKNDMPLAVIELKGTDTTDLDKVTNQGFGYKNNHKECVYVVISNFEKLRFFIHHAVDYIEFNLFTLSKEDFTTLWLCLHSDNLLDNIPAKIKAESVVKEEDITKNLYKDYSTFKQELWQSIVNLNPDGDPLMFYKKTQKLIDRFLFIFFAEDAGLLPPNSISRMVERWQMLKDEDAYKPLYDIFKQYFGYINTGRPGKTPQDEIFAYNGGLMLEDEILESITISDDVLLKHVSRLTTYDFSSEVDVNILGHIFENSLNDIEAVTAELEGQEIDKSKTKRKKDGVFYTPKYITKYIVDNTVGKLCDEKKVELNIIDEEYAKGRTNRKKETLKQLDENLQVYRNWLLQITICDPACGSGAFLNQALEYLIEEHRYIDELESQLLGAGFTFPGVESHILENNIFGVDINEESIEIAKLSLWLRTAQRGRKLTSLNNNIKCGNSLIDDPQVAGDKAFYWDKEFPTVFEKGGFDVIIGNPPYVRQELLGQQQKAFFSVKYKNVYNGIADLYVYFYDLSFQILKSFGKMGFITPNKWLERKYGFELRNYLIQLQIEEIVNMNKMDVFDDAIADPSIFLFTNSLNFNHPLKYKCPVNIDELYNQLSENFEKGKFEKDMWRFSSNKNQGIIDKFKSGETTIKDYTIGGVYYGIKTGLNQAFIITEEERTKIIDQDKNSDIIVRKMVEGDDFKRWHLNHSGRYLLATGYDLDIEQDYVGVYNHLLQFKDLLIKRQDKGKTHWNLRSCGYYDKLEKPKIIYYHTAINHNFYFDEEGYYISANCYFIGNADRYLQCILNSKLFNFIKYFLFPHFGDVENSRGVRLDGNIMNNLPLKDISNSKKLVFNDLAVSLTNQSRILENLRLKLVNYISSNWEGIKFSRKLSTWYQLDFSDFIKELNKAIKITKGAPLSKKEEFEWMDLFEENKKHALELKTQIDQTDKEIDRMVYELYGLTQEEIQIVENN